MELKIKTYSGEKFQFLKSVYLLYIFKMVSSCSETAGNSSVNFFNLKSQWGFIIVVQKS